MSDPTENIIEALSSKQKLERDRALGNLLADLPNYDSSTVDYLYSVFITVLKGSDRTWESYHGVLQAVKAVLSHKDSVITDIHLIKEIREASINLLTHTEVRVRLAAGEVLGALCLLDGCATYVQSKSQLLYLIQNNLERQPLDTEETDSKSDLHDQQMLNEKLCSEKRERRNSGDAAQIFHDTAGWRNLETSMKCLECIITGCGANFIPFIDKELLELLFTTLDHANRFVRETGYTVIAALVSCGVTEGEDFEQTNPMILYGDQVSEHLAAGLADNWSQVRLAASVATRNYLMTLPETARERFFPVLLPRICLNRYYLAEGVRLYSQETWRQVAGTEGRILVEKYIDSFVLYYIKASGADNHAVREAACTCIAELAQKIPLTSVRPYVQRLLKTLTVCFHDDSWPVRDAACLACGNFITCFPDESSSELEDLYPLFYANLQDNIPSVRQGAATAINSVVKTYGSDAFTKVLDFITEAFKGVESQPSEVKKYGDLDTGPATYGVAKQKRDNDMELHTDKQMYSCGSLAPKMGRGGCSSYRFRKTSQPWEKADGCIYLVGTLCSNPSLHRELMKILALVTSAVSHRHYTAHVSLLETLCKNLPVIAKGLGKRAFKEHLHLFFDQIFYALESESALTSSAASQCLNQLSQFLGPNILRGRVELFNPAYLHALDANTFIAPF